MKLPAFITHFAALMIVTVLCGLIYIAVQHSHRSNANDPQLQIALDLKGAVETNQSTVKWMSGDSIEISKSLSVFKTFYNASGEPLQSTGFLDAQVPKMPKGVFAFTTKCRENVITWQPRAGVRVAMVVEAVNSPQIAFVAVGRSLKEVEKRESTLVTMVLVAWLVCVGVIILHFLVSHFTSLNKK
jgi:NADH:ubiquinone oxidoreductase subunit K